MKLKAPRIRSVKFNIVINTFSAMLAMVIPVITFPYFSRILMPEGMGEYNFIMHFLSYFTLFASLGIPAYGIRACAKVRDDTDKLSKTTQELLIINIFFAVITYSVLIGVTFLIPKLQKSLTILIWMATANFIAIFTSSWLFPALEQYTYTTIKGMLSSLISVVLLFCFVRKKEDLPIYVAIQSGVAILGAIVDICYVKRFFSIKKKGKYNFKQHLKPVFLFFAMALASSVYISLDNVMLGFMIEPSRSNYVVGIYSGAIKISRMFISIITSISSVLLARLSNLVSVGENDKFKALIAKSFQLSLFLIIPLLIYFEFFAKETILVFLGSNYADSVLPMQISMPILFFIGMSNIVGMQILIPQGKEKHVMFSTIIGALVDLILNAILIPRYEAAGAAIGTLVAEGAVLIYQLIIIRKDVPDFLKRIKWYKYIVTAGVLSGVCLICKFLIPVSNLYMLAISVPTVCAAYFVMILLVKDDIANIVLSKIKAILKRIFGKKQSATEIGVKENDQSRLQDDILDVKTTIDPINCDTPKVIDEIDINNDNFLISENKTTHDDESVSDESNATKDEEAQDETKNEKGE